MNTCPTCQSTYPDDYSLCPRDGSKLTPQAMETEAQLAAGLSRRFRIIRRLGQGGMGTVFLAEQIGVGNRPVALKVLNRKLLDDPDFLLRFQNEAGSTGRIHHPNVVTIHESAQGDDGTPYIAMEFLEGESLRDVLKKRGALPVVEVAEILQQVARGLNAAHKLGIIHRDLKPDNIFLTQDDEGKLVVKVVDFGIAKLRESSAHTMTGTVLGTPAYMSYEQAAGMRSDELDARSDVYSLGVVAYEMLTGRLPFYSDTPAGYLRMHLMEAPPPLRVVDQGLKVPLAVEGPVMKALVKDRNQRFGSVAEFAEQFSKAGGVGSLNAAQTERPGVITRPLPPTTVTPLPKSYVPSAMRQTVATESIPEIVQPPQRKWLVIVGAFVLFIVATAVFLRVRPWSIISTAQRIADSSPSTTLTPKEQIESTPAITFNPFVLERTLSNFRGEVDTVAFSPDGKFLASGSTYDPILLGLSKANTETTTTVKLWEVESGSLKRTLSDQKVHGFLRAVEFSPDGELLATCNGDHSIGLWDVASGTLSRTLNQPMRHDDQVLSVAFSPDGKTLVSGGSDQIVKLWDVASGTAKKTLALSTEKAQFGFVGSVPVAFSPDGRLLAVSVGENTVKLWDTATETLVRNLTGHTGVVNSVSFSPDGTLLASASDDGTIRLWDSTSGALRQTLTNNGGNVEAVAFSPDGMLIASGGEAKTVTLWDVASGTLRQTLTGHRDAIFSVSFSPDGKMLASGSVDKTVKLWRHGGVVAGPIRQQLSVKATLSKMFGTQGGERKNAKDGLKYVWIPPGTFMMGCSPGDTNCVGDEKPPHQVNITKGFWLAQTEVTVGAYKRFAAATGKAMPYGDDSDNPGWSNDRMPIVDVDWEEAKAYCAWAAGGRLPTEAEWEYAARGGSTEARYGSLDEIAWYYANSGGQTHEVGQKRANDFGLYDMLGNVDEWVNDWYDSTYYKESPSQDPWGPASGEYRLLRGGSYSTPPTLCRVSPRSFLKPSDYRYVTLGFRCVGGAFAP